MWSVYRTGFPDAYATSAGDYSYNGFPFTGMGWSCDRNPHSRTHVGVTEFIIKKGAEVTVAAPVDPPAFCEEKPAMPARPGGS
jgi:hypothetical protein